MVGPQAGHPLPPLPAGCFPAGPQSSGAGSLERELGALGSSLHRRVSPGSALVVGSGRTRAHVGFPLHLDPQSGLLAAKPQTGLDCRPAPLPSCLSQPQSGGVQMGWVRPVGVALPGPEPVQRQMVSTPPAPSAPAACLLLRRRVPPPGAPRQGSQASGWVCAGTKPLPVWAAKPLTAPLSRVQKHVFQVHAEEKTGGIGNFRKRQ